MAKNDYVPLEGDRCLSQPSAELLLRSALGKHFQDPLCIQLAATHAAGVAVAGFAVGLLADHVSMLYDHADFCLVEAKFEEVYLVAQLMQQHDLLGDLLTLVGHLCPEKFREHVSFKILLPEDIDTLDILGSLEEDLEALFGTLFALLSDLEDSVVGKMATLISEFSIADASPDTDCKSTFKPLLMKAVKDLKAIKKCLTKILAVLYALIANVQKDWKLDYQQLNTTNGC